MAITSATKGADALKTSLAEAKQGGKIDPSNPKTYGAVIDKIEADLAKQGLFGASYEDALKLLEASPSLKDHEVAAAFRKRDAERAAAAGAPMTAKVDPFKDPSVAGSKPLIAFFSTCQPSLPKPGSTDAAKLNAANTAEVTSKTKTPTQPQVHTCEEGPAIRGQFTFKKLSGTLYDGAHPSPNDVSQRNIGNCWFAASMASVAAKNPGAVEKMITDNKDGTYTIHIYDKDPTSGTIKRFDVVVDAHFPVHSDKPGQGFYSATSPLWYALIEKAYAKHLGGYQFLANNDTGAVDPCLGATGTAATYSATPSSDVAFITSLSSGKGSTTLSTAKSAAPTLTPDHVYTVLRVYKKDGVDMVELRNPWGGAGSTFSLPVAKLRPLTSGVTAG